VKKYMVFFVLCFLSVGLPLEGEARTVNPKDATPAVASKPIPKKGAPRSIKPVVQAVMASNRVRGSKKASEETVEAKEVEEEESADPELTEAQKKQKVVDDFLKDEHRVKGLLEKLTDTLGKNMMQKKMTQAEINKNPQAAIDKLQQAYSYYYSGFIGSEVHDNMEEWIKDLLDKIDTALRADVKKIAATSN
jgi:uncharacterized membrane-anchored protein YjiN (DUF445 family)